MLEEVPMDLRHPIFLDFLNRDITKIEALREISQFNITNKEEAKVALEVFLICNNQRNTEEMIKAYDKAEKDLLKELSGLEKSGNSTESKKRVIQSVRKERSKINKAILLVPYAERQTYLDQIKIER